MTYVPDYILHAGPKSPISGPTAPTITPKHNHRRIESFASNGSRSAPSAGVRERQSSKAMISSDNNNSNPSTRKRSVTNPSYTPSSRYFKAPQERVCARVSIKDRLRSLESEAAVKLEVRHTSQRRQRRPLSHDTTQGPPPGLDYDRRSKDNSSISSVNSAMSDSLEKVPDSFKVAMPKPDIIASNQPKSNAHAPKQKVEPLKLHSGSEELISDKLVERKDGIHVRDSEDLLKQKAIVSEDSFKKKAIVQENSAGLECANSLSEQVEESAFVPETVKTQDVKNVPQMEESDGNSPQMEKSDENTPRTRELAVDVSRMAEQNVHRGKGDTKVPFNDLELTKLAAQSPLHDPADNNFAGGEQRIVRPARSAENLGPKPKQSYLKTAAPGANGTAFRPIWRTPSLKQVQHPRHYSADDNSAGMKEHEKVSILQLASSFKLGEKRVNNSAQVSHPISDDKQEQIDATVSLAESKSTPVDERGSASLKATELTAVHETDAAATATAAQPTTAYPVELRSPRHEHSGQAFRRQNTRDKRNARVFIVPSSSDSDMDGGNQMSRMEKDFAKMGLSRAVDLLPDQHTVVGNNNHTAAVKIPSPMVTIKNVPPVKFVPNLLKPNDKAVTTTQETKKKSTDLQSAKIYPELLTPSGSSRRGSKSRDGEGKKDSQKSPNRRRKSTRSGRSGATSRSKSTDTRRTGRDDQRNRSNSMCDPQRMRQSREAVANAVIFGTGHGSTIPYIDDATSPVEDTTLEAKLSAPQKFTANEANRGSIHRSNSADVLSTLVTNVPHPKMRRARASSVDRSTAKGVHRRSYQIATMAQDGDPAHQQNVDRLNKFLLHVDKDGNGDSSLGDQDLSTRSGLLHFKVATIDKGKRTSSQKSWRLVWAMLRDQKLCLSKDSGKTKNVQDPLQERRSSQQPHEESLSFNVQSSLVGIAYNYLKRRNVFKLTTFNGSEYLFQADNRGDMLAWISAIQKQSSAWEDGAEGISEDLILRKTGQIDCGPKSEKKSIRKRSPKVAQKNNLQVKDVDGSRRFKWRGSVTKIVKKFGTGQPFVLNGTFEVHLEDCPPSAANEFVPFIVELCCRIVEERGLQFTGIYRVPGNSAALSALQEDLNNHGVESIRQDDERLKELNVVSSLLKSFFRKLPEPLFTNELYHDFIQANRKPTPESRLNSLRKLVHMLPGPHYETLKFLIEHLRLVADNCESNKMEVRNLAIVFGPTLVRNTAADNTATMVTDMSDQCRIIESIIDHTGWFFSSDVSEPVPQSSGAAVPAEKEYEAVPSIEFLLSNVGRKPGDTGNTSESAKSKGSDDSENSFSRDLIDMLFGKKWKQQANQPEASEQDDGGFGEYRSRNHNDTASPKKEGEKSSSAAVATTTATTAIPQTQPSQTSDISERLLTFYQEHLDRLSQTTVDQTYLAFSSADSSPRATPRHSASHIAQPPEVAPRRIRASSDSQDPRHHHVTNTTEAAPPRALHSHRAHWPEMTSRFVGAPQYKPPPNPYQPVTGPPAPPRTRKISSDLSTTDTQAMRSAQHKITNKVEVQERPTPMRKPSTVDTLPQTGDIVPTKGPNVDESIAQVAVNERLVGELPKKSPPATNPKELKSSSRAVISDSRPASKTTKKKSTASLNAETYVGLGKKLSVAGLDAVADSTQPKRKKSPLKDASAAVATGASSERLFSRGDPKRRGIRFVSTENDRAFDLDPSSSKNQQLTATERLFNGQPLRRKHSARGNRQQKVARRHTLSGLRDLQQGLPVLKFRSNLQNASKGANLSMHDLTSGQCHQRSAMERLDPKGATSGLTLSNWMVQQRLRDKTPHASGLSSANITKRKKYKNQFRSYV